METVTELLAECRRRFYNDLMLRDGSRQNLHALNLNRQFMLEHNTFMRENAGHTK